MVQGRCQCAGLAGFAQPITPKARDLALKSGPNTAAEKTNLSPPACSRRMAKLKEAGLIRKTVALVNPRALGYNGLVIIGVVLDRSTTDSFAAFEKAVASLTGCLEVQLVTGEFDYFVKLRIQSIDSFNELHAAQLIGLPGVRQIRTFVCLKEVFETTVIPV